MSEQGFIKDVILICRSESRTHFKMEFQRYERPPCMHERQTLQNPETLDDNVLVLLSRSGTAADAKSYSSGASDTISWSTIDPSDNGVMRRLNARDLARMPLALGYFVHGFLLVTRFPAARYTHRQLRLDHPQSAVFFCVARDSLELWSSLPPLYVSHQLIVSCSTS
jgi:hypothetical protein